VPPRKSSGTAAHASFTRALIYSWYRCCVIKLAANLPMQEYTYSQGDRSVKASTRCKREASGLEDGRQPTLRCQPLAPMTWKVWIHVRALSFLKVQALGNPRNCRRGASTGAHPQPGSPRTSAASPAPGHPRRLPRLASHIHRRLVLLSIAVDAALVWLLLETY
jgi:hypothetical protein